MNQILESNPVPVLWVTNRIEQIDPAFRRRFTYHLELSSPPPGARERLVRKLLAEVPVSDAFVSRLTERENLTPAQIANALRFANLVEHEDASQLEAWMERQLAHADMALGHRPQGTRQRRSGRGIVGQQQRRPARVAGQPGLPQGTVGVATVGRAV